MPVVTASSPVPSPTPEQRRIATESFTRARNAITGGHLDYAITLLMTCCRLDPANFPYRQTLRKTQKDKYGNNLRGNRFAFLVTPRWKGKMKSAKRSREYLKVLEFGEHVLGRNPWDMGAQLDMAEAFDALGLNDLAVFTLDQARQKYPRDSTLNRALARLFEKRGDYQKAIVLWQLVKEVHPTDVEAAHKAKDLAANETIHKGQYEAAASGSKESPILGKIEARANEKQDRQAREAEPLLKRIEADPTEPSLYIQLAAIYRKHNQVDRARAVIQQGLGPTGSAFQLQLELMDLDLGPLRKKLEEIENRLKKIKEKSKNRQNDDDDVPAKDEDEEELSERDLAQKQNEYLKEINTREIEYFRVKADRFPNDAWHNIELGLRLLKADLVEEAIAEFQKARRDEKVKWKASMYLGVCFKKRNNWRLAQRNFEESLTAVPPTDEPARKELLYQLARGCAENGDLARAIDLGHELANLDFAFKNIGKLLDEWNDRLQSA